MAAPISNPRSHRRCPLLALAAGAGAGLAVALSFLAPDLFADHPDPRQLRGTWAFDAERFDAALPATAAASTGMALLRGFRQRLRAEFLTAQLSLDTDSCAVGGMARPLPPTPCSYVGVSALALMVRLAAVDAPPMQLIIDPQDRERLTWNIRGNSIPLRRIAATPAFTEPGRR